ncbi:MAG: biotin--[acetyl-CoA-carboxylase] ligase [Holosporaceae bacterium]|nr:MAG: biotin--[acetyl-CoA-carboxylase] ligase [Holosporaceae bacterium]
MKYTYEWIEHTSSTMDEAKIWAEKNASTAEKVPHFIQAGLQSIGRGKAGRNWVSKKGNFFSTLILHFPHSLDKRGQISFVTGVSVVRALREFKKNLPVKLKWPNDFYVEGKKLGGILLEFHDYGQPYLCIAVGINFVSNPAHVSSTHLKKLGLDLDLHLFRRVFLKNLLEDYKTWVDNGFSKIKNSWISNSLHKDSMVSISLGKRKYVGEFHTISDVGELVLKNEDGKSIVFSTGEVFFE